jgi:hypothetical protein|tara:strand:+ start:253 stop:426 length:174 start_codon:yes stop_codon:yes gene_type:complete
MNIITDVMFYSYCKAYNVNPVDALHTPVSLMKKMLIIQSVATEIEQEEMDKAQKQLK